MVGYVHFFFNFHFLDLHLLLRNATQFQRPSTNKKNPLKVGQPKSARVKSPRVENSLR